VRITADTNVLVRSAVRDDVAQARLADETLREATQITVALASLCEFVWVLRRGYGIAVADIAAAVRALLATDKVVVDRTAAEAGLAMLEAGGDFADGVIAHEGEELGAEVFVSFDQSAVKRLTDKGRAARLLRG
jgi:predicted nucleic-acid-binding protein